MDSTIFIGLPTEDFQVPSLADSNSVLRDLSDTKISDALLLGDLILITNFDVGSRGSLKWIREF